MTRWRFLLVVLPGLIALSVWLVVAGKGGHHVFLHNPLSDLADMAGCYWMWLGPLVVFGFVGLWRSARALAWAAIGWTAAVIVALLLIDIGDTGSRMIVPALTLLTLGVFLSLRKGIVGRITVAVLVLFLMVQSRATIAALPNNVNFNSETWKQSKAIAQLTENGIPDSLIFSNAVDGIWYATGRMTNPLPRFDGIPAQVPNPKPMDGPCIAVYFKSQMGRRYFGDPNIYQDRVMRDTTGGQDRQMVYDMGDAWAMQLGAK